MKKPLPLPTNPVKTLSTPSIDIREIKITIIGTSPLLVHKFSEKAKKQMEEKHAQKAKQKPGARDPMEEYQASLYKFPNLKKTTYGIPTAAIKNCAVTACKFIDGIPMTVARGAFHVIEDFAGLTEIKSPGPVMDERPVNIGGFKKIKMIRYRGRFDVWEATFSVRYNAGIISDEQIANIFQMAGFSVGLCEHRPEKNGTLGTFKLKGT